MIILDFYSYLPLRLCCCCCCIPTCHSGVHFFLCCSAIEIGENKTSQHPDYIYLLSIRLERISAKDIGVVH
uniref:Secreted protein n=1 Tax=Arundo donax TaxID=35708 RepID=A0A0A8ZLW0_ARUDO